MDNVETFDLSRVRRTLAPGIKDPGGNPEGVVGHPAQLDVHYHPSTVIVCKDVADILTKRYPGWAWAVEPDDKGQIINVYNLYCHTEFAFTIRYDEIMDDPRRKWATAAGHQLLRRFRMPDRMNPDKLAEAPRDAKGMLIPDLGDFPPSKMKDNAMIALKLATGEWEIVETTEGRYLRKTR